MSTAKPVRLVDKIKWLPTDLVLRDSDRQTGLHLMQPRYYIGLGPVTPESPMGKDYQLNLDNTAFEVNTFLAEMISQPKG